MTRYDQMWHIRTSLDRLLLQIYRWCWSARPRRSAQRAGSIGYTRDVWHLTRTCAFSASRFEPTGHVVLDGHAYRRSVSGLAEHVAFMDVSAQHVQPGYGSVLRPIAYLGPGN